MAYERVPEGLMLLPMRYQPGLGAPAAGWGVAVRGGKSLGRQRTQYRAAAPFGSVASTSAAWFSSRSTVAVWEALGSVVVGATRATVPPGTALMVKLTELVPAAQRST